MGQPKSIFMIVHRHRINAGHGDSADSIEIVGPNYYHPEQSFPAFLDRESAETFLKGTNTFCNSIKEIPIYETP